MALPVVVGAIGIALDFGRVTQVRQRLQARLDSAALAAVQAGDLQNAKSMFAKFIESNDPDRADNLSLVAKVDAFDGVKLEASADGTLPMTFGALVGVEKITIKLQSVAEKSAGHEDLYFAVDLSSSLGVGATSADRDALEALTRPYTTPAYGSILPQGCAFGCHSREGWEPAGKTVYQMARDAGIKLREDELNLQFNGLVDLLLDPADKIVQKGLRRISVIGFSEYAKELAPPSTSSSAVKSVLANFPAYDRYGTDFVNSFSEICRLLGTQGNGTANEPRKTLVLITDGIDSRSAYFAQKAINANSCQQIKDAGFRLAVVEIKYPKLANNALYRDTVLPVETTISPAMSACASPGWYFQAIDTPEIPAKFVELKGKIKAESVRLSQ